MRGQEASLLEDDGEPNSVGLPAVLRRFWKAMALLTAASALYTAFTAHLWNLAIPWGLPLLWDDSRAGDFLVFRPGFLHFGAPDFWSSFEYPFTYPAPLVIVFGLLFRLHHPVRAYVLFLLAALALGSWMFVRQLVRRNVTPAVAWLFTLTTLLMTWPLLFQLDTANIEGLVVVILACGVVAALQDRWLLACTLIGIAGSMKLFPLLLLGLALGSRRYKAFTLGLAAAAITTLASLAIVGPTIPQAQQHINVGLQLVRDRYFFSMLRVAPAFDHSLWMPVRFAAVYADRLLHRLPAARQADRTRHVLELSLILYLAAAAVFGLTLFFRRLRRMPILNQLLAWMVCAVLLPPLSLEYTLLHLLLPFALLCTYACDMARRGEHIPGLELALFSFVLIFNVNSFLNHRFLFASEFRLIGLLVLLFAVVRFPFQSMLRKRA